MAATLQLVAVSYTQTGANLIGFGSSYKKAPPTKVLESNQEFWLGTAPRRHLDLYIRRQHELY